MSRRPSKEVSVHERQGTDTSRDDDLAGLEDLPLEELSVQPYYIPAEDSGEYRRISSSVPASNGTDDNSGAALPSTTATEGLEDQPSRPAGPVSIVDNDGDIDPLDERDIAEAPMPVASSSRPVKPLNKLPQRTSTARSSLSDEEEPDQVLPERVPLLQRQRIMELRQFRESKLFFSGSIFTPIYFDNTLTEARDLCASERNYLAGIKLSLYLGAAGAVLMLNFRLPQNGDVSKPLPGSSSSTKISEGLAILFFCLSLVTLIATFINYVHSVAAYAMMKSRVTNKRVVQVAMFGSALVIFGANVALLVRPDLAGNH